MMNRDKIRKEGMVMIHKGLGFVAVLKSCLLHIQQAFYRLHPQPEDKYKLVELPVPRLTTHYSSEMPKHTILPEIGVGVYQGDIVAIRLMVADPLQPHRRRWVISRLYSDDLRHIDKELAKSLFLVACYLRYGIPFCLLKTDSQKLYGKTQPTECHYAILHHKPQSSSEGDDNNAKVHQCQGKVIRKILKCLESLQLTCPDYRRGNKGCQQKPSRNRAEPVSNSCA